MFVLSSRSTFTRWGSAFLFLALLWTVIFVLGVEMNTGGTSLGERIDDDGPWGWSGSLRNWKNIATEWANWSDSKNKWGAGNSLNEKNSMIDVRPKARQLGSWSSPQGGPLREEPKFLSYLPHSGFHNQRQALQNALALSLALNRILLVPPIWLGQSPGYLEYDLLSWVWDHVARQDNGTQINPMFLRDVTVDNNNGTEWTNGKMWKPSIQPGHITKADFPAPPVAKQTSEERKMRYQFSAGDTFVSYDFLFDLAPIEERMEEEMRVIDRSEVRSGRLPGWVGNGLGNRWYGDGKGLGGMSEAGTGWEVLKGGLKENDILFFKDKGRYDYLFSDHHSPDAPLVTPVVTDLYSPWRNYNHSINIQRLRQSPEKLILLGSLFGTSRINLTNTYRTKPESDGAVRKTVDQHDWGNRLILSQKMLERVADATKKVLMAIAQQNQGQTNWWKHGEDDVYYVAAQARVRDGNFQATADSKMKEVWERLVGQVLRINNRKNGDPSSSIDERGVKNKLMRMDIARKELLERQRSSRNKRSGLVEDGFRTGNSSSVSNVPLCSWSFWDSQMDENEPLAFSSYSPLASNAFQRVVRSHSPRGLTNENTIEAKKTFVPRRSKRSPPRASKDLASHLSCHSPLHADPNLQPFNVPLYLATDSRFPSRDPVLSLFYTTFPCLFTYTDLSGLDNLRDEKQPGIVSRAKSLSSHFIPTWLPALRGSKRQLLGFKNVESWVNAGDNVPLGQYMIPILDAMIAARGEVMIGTRGSTFSQYIEKVLWPAVYSKSLEE